MALPDRDNQRNSGPPTCGKILFLSPLCCSSFQLDGRMGQAWMDKNEQRGEEYRFKSLFHAVPAGDLGQPADFSSPLCLLCQQGSERPHRAPSRMGRWCMESISRGGRRPVATHWPRAASCCWGQAASTLTFLVCHHLDSGWKEARPALVLLPCFPGNSVES